MPDLKIQPSTLAQLRVRWSVSDPGKGIAFTYVTCMGNACDVPTRIGGYAFSPDGTQLAVGVCMGDVTDDKGDTSHLRYMCAGGGEVQLYQASDGRSAGTVSVSGFPLSVAFDPGGKTLAIGTADGHVELWDLGSSQRLQDLQHPSKRTGVTSVAFSGDGSLLVSQGDGKVLVWDPAKGSMLKSMAGWGAISADPSGQRLIASWFDPNVAAVVVRIFDLTHPGQFRDVRPKFVQANMLDQRILSAFSKDGQGLLILGSNGAEWWDAQGTAAKGHTDITKLIADKKDAFSPFGAVTADGLVLTEPWIDIAMPGIPLPPSALSGSGFTSTCGFFLWDPTTPGAFAIPASDGCQNPITAGDGARAVVSRDGTLIAADDGSGNMRVWAVDPTAAPATPTCLGKCPGS